MGAGVCEGVKGLLVEEGKVEDFSFFQVVEVLASFFLFIGGVLVTRREFLQVLLVGVSGVTVESLAGVIGLVEGLVLNSSFSIAMLEGGSLLDFSRFRESIEGSLVSLGVARLLRGLLLGMGSARKMLGGLWSGLGVVQEFSMVGVLVGGLQLDSWGSAMGSLAALYLNTQGSGLSRVVGLVEGL